MNGIDVLSNLMADNERKPATAGIFPPSVYMCTFIRLFNTKWTIRWRVRRKATTNCSLSMVPIIPHIRRHIRRHIRSFNHSFPLPEVNSISLKPTTTTPYSRRQIVITTERKNSCVLNQTWANNRQHADN